LTKDVKRIRLRITECKKEIISEGEMKTLDQKTQEKRLIRAKD